jgi:hypothetical protein
VEAAKLNFNFIPNTAQENLLEKYNFYRQCFGSEATHEIAELTPTQRATTNILHTFNKT